MAKVSRTVGKSLTYTPPAAGSKIKKLPINPDAAAEVAETVEDKKKAAEKVQMYRAAYNIPKGSKLDRALKNVLFNNQVNMQDFSIAILGKELIKHGEITREEVESYFPKLYHYLLDDPKK